MDTLKIGSGAVRLKIVRDGVEGVISFNPLDVGFMERAYKLMEDAEGKEKEYHDKLLAAEKTGGIKEKIAVVKEYCIYMREQVDYCFGQGTSDTVFGDSLDVDMFADFLEGVAPYIRKAQGARIKKYLPDEQGAVMQ